jgi:hypothetical protein
LNRLGRSGIVALESFIEAIRDAGYRGPGAALAELIDNAWEAQATRVAITLTRTAGDVKVTVQDDGHGMTPTVLRLSLQFGGTTRFDSRCGLGRYGMGLPAASLSQARRVDVYTWTSKNVWWSYLDVDEVRTGRTRAVPSPRRCRPKEASSTKTGTRIIWSQCDRLQHLDESDWERQLRADLGRTFREQLWSGRRLTLNGTAIQPVDPLFLRKGENLTGAAPFGVPLVFAIEVADDRGRPRASRVVVRFVELPVKTWQGLSNEEKRRWGISKRAGVSVLRAGREIDSGWFFMGRKRKENYDDWWRCEVSFEPELDELFGVSHTKQGVRPTPALLRVLAPDLERVAHDLNSRVRRAFVELHRHARVGRAAARARQRDELLEPLTRRTRTTLGRHVRNGLRYRITHEDLDDGYCFEPRLRAGEIVLALNRAHPLFDALTRNEGANGSRETLELLLLAAARAELRHRGVERQVLQAFRQRWSTALTAFLS